MGGEFRIGPPGESVEDQNAQRLLAGQAGAPRPRIVRTAGVEVLRNEQGDRTLPGQRRAHHRQFGGMRTPEPRHAAW